MQRERVSAVKEVCEGVGTVSQRARTHFLWADAAAKPAALELVGCELLTGWDCRHRLCVVVDVVVVVIGRQDRARWHRDSQGSHRRDRNGCDGCDGHGRNWDGLHFCSALSGRCSFKQHPNQLYSLGCAKSFERLELHRVRVRVRVRVIVRVRLG